MSIVSLLTVLVSTGTSLKSEVEQLVARGSHNPKVAGSNPAFASPDKTGSIIMRKYLISYKPDDVEEPVKTEEGTPGTETGAQEGTAAGE
jgi:hypothetical protein